MRTIRTLRPIPIPAPSLLFFTQSPYLTLYFQRKVFCAIHDSLLSIIIPSPASPLSFPSPFALIYFLFLIILTAMIYSHFVQSQQSLNYVPLYPLYYLIFSIFHWLLRHFNFIHFDDLVDSVITYFNLLTFSLIHVVRLFVISFHFFHVVYFIIPTTSCFRLFFHEKFIHVLLLFIIVYFILLVLVFLQGQLLFIYFRFKIVQGQALVKVLAMVMGQVRLFELVLQLSLLSFFLIHVLFGYVLFPHEQFNVLFIYFLFKLAIHFLLLLHFCPLSLNFCYPLCQFIIVNILFILSNLRLTFSHSLLTSFIHFFNLIFLYVILYFMYLTIYFQSGYFNFDKCPNNSFNFQFFGRQLLHVFVDHLNPQEEMALTLRYQVIYY